MDRQSILKAFDKHLGSSGRRYYSDFYIGVTDNVENDLFRRHRVAKEGSWYIYAPADSPEIATAIEKHFGNMGMRTSVDLKRQEPAETTTTKEEQLNSSPKIVYCYAVSPHTVEYAV